MVQLNPCLRAGRTVEGLSAIFRVAIQERPRKSKRGYPEGESPTFPHPRPFSPQSAGNIRYKKGVVSMNWKKLFGVDSTKELAADAVYAVAGSVLFGMGIYTFAKSASFAPGGLTGLALILNHLFRLPIGATTVVLNIPLILISYRVVGRQFLVKSFCTMLVSSFFLDALFPLTPMYAGNDLLAAVFSGVTMGAGLALVYMRGSSTGGTDFLIVSVKKLKPHISMGQITLLTDITVILAGGLVFRNIDAVLYGVVCIYVESLVIDKIMYGAGGSKMAIIITADGLRLAQRISDATARGSTLVKAIGTYSGQERHLLLCVCGKTEITRVRALAHETDPGAFVTITEVSEVVGEGFTMPDNGA